MAVLFGIEPTVSKEDATWTSFMLKAWDLAQFNFYFVVFAMFVAYMDQLHLQIAAQSHAKEGIIVKSEITN